MTSNYPNGFNLRTLGRMARSKIVSYIHTLDCNEYFLNLMDLNGRSEEVKLDYLKIFSDHLYARVCSLFLEACPLSILESILSKVETSRGFFRRSGKMNLFAKRVFKNNRVNLVRLLTSKPRLLIDYNAYNSVVEFFEARNKLILPEIGFITMPEPMYETLIEWNCSSKPLAMASTCQNVDNSRGEGFKRFPDIKSSTLYKGQTKEKYIKFEDPISKKIYDLSNSVLWILEASGEVASKQETIEGSTIFKAYKYTLSLYGVQDVHAMLRRAISGAGSNIAHRLSGRLFRPFVDLHVFPNLLGSISSVIAQKREVEAIHPEARGA